MKLSAATIAGLRDDRATALTNASTVRDRLARATTEDMASAADYRMYLTQARDYTEILREADPDGTYDDVETDVIAGRELIGAIHSVANLMALVPLPAELPKKPRLELRINVQDATVGDALIEAVAASGGAWHSDAPYTGETDIWRHARYYGDVINLDVSIWWPKPEPVDVDPAAAEGAEATA
jgi:hypothetical protein